MHGIIILRSLRWLDRRLARIQKTRSPLRKDSFLFEQQILLRDS